MDGMSVRDKVAQLFVIEISRDPSDSTKAWQDSVVATYGIGGAILMRGPIEPFIERVNELQAESLIPILISTDAEWGAAMRFQEYRPYPRQMQLGRIKHAERLVYRMGRNVAHELRDLGIYVNYAPVADVGPDSLNLMYDQREFSNDPHAAADLCTAYMKGMQDGGIYACGKHYPGHGDTEVDSHLDLPVLRFDRARMDSIELVPFGKMINNGLEMMMIAHLSIPSVDSIGIPMSISEKCIKKLLRGEQGFKGVVITDAVGMKGLSDGSRNAVEINTAVYRAGSDFILMPDMVVESIEAITDSVNVGTFPLSELDEKVHRVLMLKARAGFFDKDFDPCVRDLERKIKAAERRDTRLQRRMLRAIESSSNPLLESATEDGTLVLDKPGI